MRRGNSLSGLPQPSAATPRSAVPSCVRPRIITLIRAGTKPRKVVRLLLNKRNAPSLDHVLEAVTEAVKLDSGAVRKVFALSGQLVDSLERFFQDDDVFVAYGNEKCCPEDFQLDQEESKCFKKGSMGGRRLGERPKMPNKSGKKSLRGTQVRTPSPGSHILPEDMRAKYSLGHVIGNGNFSTVRYCTHK